MSYPCHTTEVEGEKVWVHSNEVSIELLQSHMREIWIIRFQFKRQRITWLLQDDVYCKVVITRNRNYEKCGFRISRKNLWTIVPQKKTAKRKAQKGKKKMYINNNSCVPNWWILSYSTALNVNLPALLQPPPVHPPQPGLLSHSYWWRCWSLERIMRRMSPIQEKWYIGIYLNILGKCIYQIYKINTRSRLTTFSTPMTTLSLYWPLVP